MANTNIDNHIPKSRHRGWSTHLASRRYRLAQPNRTPSRSFVTPGGIGTHRMHPPRKRNHRDSNITHGSHKQFDTRGPAQRPAPTQSLCSKQSAQQTEAASRRDASTGQAKPPGFQHCIRQPQAIRHTRAGAAAGPYAEFINENHHSHFVTSVTSRCAVE